MVLALPLADIGIGQLVWAAILIFGAVSWVFSQIQEQKKQREAQQRRPNPGDVNETARRRKQQAQRPARADGDGKLSPAERRRRAEEALIRQGIPPEVLRQGRQEEPPRQGRPQRQEQARPERRPPPQPAPKPKAEPVLTSLGESVTAGGVTSTEIGTGRAARNARRGGSKALRLRDQLRKKDQFLSIVVAGEVIAPPVSLRAGYGRDGSADRA